MMNKNISAGGGMRQQQLPVEMEEEILCRLPVKSLARFRCVSKSWRSLINQHRFARKHLPFAARPDNLTMILFNPGAQLTYSRKYIVLASCDGLLCVGEDNKWVYLWNPNINKWRTVPDPKDPQSSYHVFGLSSAFKLGYDSATEDYKLIKFTRVMQSGYRGYDCETEVFSLKSGAWRKLDDFAELQLGTMCSVVFVNGSIYWLSCYFYWQVITYSLLEDKYREVRLPECYPVESPFEGEDEHVKIMVLKGMVCVVALREHSFVLWAMMKKNTDAWTKVLDIPFENENIPFGMPSEFINYKVLFMYEDGEVLLGLVFMRKTELLICKENRVLWRQVDFEEGSTIEYSFVHVETLLSPLP